MTHLAAAFASLVGRDLAAVPWARAGSKFVGMVAYFAVIGALGYRLVRVRLQSAAGAPDAAALIGADRRAAGIGLLGALLLLPDFALAVAHQAGARTGWSAWLAAARPEDVAELVLAPLLILAFAFAARNRHRAWSAALLLGLLLAVRSALNGRLAAQINPLHEAAAALWLGTLAVLVLAFLPAVLREQTPREQRGPLVADLVRRYSPLALFSAAGVAVTGLATTWIHLKYLSALWTTPYGQVLLLKLCFVASIVALGAWNWRRALPTLGTEEAAGRLRQSATLEFVVTLVVLVVSAALSSMPSPRLPRLDRKGTPVSQVAAGGLSADAAPSH